MLDTKSVAAIRLDLNSAISPGRNVASKHRATDCAHDEKRREDSTCPPHIESDNGIATLLDLAIDQLRDQITRDHKENVDADKAAVKLFYFEMIKDDGDNGERAQAVDIRAVFDFGQNGGLTSV
jgi:hypothetical protein